MAITAGENVLRLAPPLVVTDADLDEAVVDAASCHAARAAFGRQGSSEMSASLRRTERSEGRSTNEDLVRGTSSICAISILRRCARCWTSRPTTSAVACRRDRSPARRWR